MLQDLPLPPSSGDSTIIIGGNAAQGISSGEQYITYQNGTTNSNAWMVGMDDGEDWRFAYGAVGEITDANSLIRLTQSGNMLIGTTTDNGSRLRVNGSIALPHVIKSANYTLDATDYTVGFDCASNRTANLPDATTCAGRIYVIYQYNTNTGMRYVTIDPNGSQTISGVATYPLSSYGDFSSVMIQSTGSNWVVISDALYFIPL
jgi:hypothetical protein